MSRRTALTAALLLAACGREAVEPAPAPSSEEVAAELAVARAGCGRCHEMADQTLAHLRPLRGPDLATAAGWRADGGAAFLRAHHGGGDAEDLAAWVSSLAGEASVLRPVEVSAGSIERGERLFAEFGCGACHAPSALRDLARRTDHAHVRGFLLDPAEHRPGTPHDFGLTPVEAGALAAFVLRAQRCTENPPPVRGFAFECFELEIDSEGLPDLDALEPAARGICRRIDVERRTRDDHFALRFEATLDVPASGRWTFTTGSDDSSWLWIDGRLVVRNEGLRPHHLASGTVELTAGEHQLVVLHTEATGLQSLEALWEGPGVDRQPIPVERALATVDEVLKPPAAAPVPSVEAVRRGRSAAVRRRCTACHRALDGDLEHEAAPGPAPVWSALRGGPCPADRRALALWPLVRASLERRRDAAARLGFAMRRDGCLRCHTRDGEGGLPPAVRGGLVEVEDLGDEGILPPDLSGVGRRLRRDWIAEVIGGGRRARPYVRLRMPKLPKESGERYADWFAEIDGAGVEDAEPPFSAEAVARGRRLVGVRGKGCVSCHRFASLPSTGVQGMDLAIQFERLRPAWFRQWVLHSVALRPGTRMPRLWPMDGDEARHDVDAIRSWMSLGASAPVPEGVRAAKGSWRLVPADRPILHGAFLEGISARCLAVGTSDRAHYAFDLASGRLVWLWRGAFLDAAGTWSGRAGKLLRPLGRDWLRIDDFLVDGEASRRTLGRRIDPDGYPIFRFEAGSAVYDDVVRPRRTDEGLVLVRTLRCRSGTMRIELTPTTKTEGLSLSVDGRAAPATKRLSAGQSVEVVYRW